MANLDFCNICGCSKADADQTSTVCENCKQLYFDEETGEQILGPEDYIDFLLIPATVCCFGCGNPLAAEDVGHSDYCSLRCLNLDSAGPFRT